MKRKGWHLFAAAGVLLVVLLPCRNLWMGDGWTWLNYFDTNSLNQMSLTRGGGMYLYFFPMLLYNLFGFAMSYVFGAVYFAYSFLLAREDRKFAVLFVLPIIQVFAGYVEIYAAVYAMTVATYYYRIKGNETLFSVFGVLTFMCHVVIGLAVVSLVLTHWFRRREYLAGGLLGLSVIGYLMYINGAFTRESPFFSLSGYYSLFSPTHLLELASLFVFLHLWLLLSLRRVEIKREWELAVPVLIAVGLTVITIPHIGMFRDWDLLSMSLLPLAFWYLSRISRVRITALTVCLVVTTAFMAFNFSNPRQVMLDYMLITPQYSPEFFDGHQLVKTLTIYSNIVDDRQAEQILFQTRTEGYDLDELYIKWKEAGLLNTK